MEIGILSDTHNNIGNLQKALSVFRSSGVQLLVHCGDVTEPATAQEINDFRIIHVLGNGDVDADGIRTALLSRDPNNITQDIYTGLIAGVNCAVLHGDAQDKVKQLIASGQYRFVFHGHTHRRRDETIGSCRVINPGALGGLHASSRSICILDLPSGDARFVEI